MQFFSQLDSVSQIFLIAIFALIFGSFASLLSHRLATNEPIIFARSKCPSCNQVLKIFNLIPIFSWLLQRGKCSNCGAKISLRYPLIELVFLLSFLVIFLAEGHQLSTQTLLHFAIAGTMIVMCITDLEHYFIPKKLQYALATFTTILLLVKGGPALVLHNVPSALIYCGFGLALLALFRFTAKVEAIGIDDIEFFFIAGLLLGVNNFLNFMFLSGFFGLIFGSLWQKFTSEKTFPFAPAICLAAMICLLSNGKFKLVDAMGSLLFLQTF